MTGFYNMKLRFIELFIIVLVLTLSSGTVYPQDNVWVIFNKARENASRGDMDIAFMFLESLLDRFPGSGYVPYALFATGEHYFSLSDYSDASSAFIRLLDEYPGFRAEMFALAYLLKIAKLYGKESLIHDLKGKIISSNKVVLSPKKKKVYKYRSALCKNYKAIYYIDKVEFYLEGKLFEEILY